MQTGTIEGFRLSPQQKHLWVLQSNGYNQAYRLLGSISIAGELNLDILEKTLATIGQQYEIFRTTFQCPAGMSIPVQVIVDESALSHQRYDLSKLTSQEQETELARLVQEARYLPFDLEQGPLLNVFVITLSPTDHKLLIALPAFCADAPTLYSLLNEIGDTYTATLQGQDSLDDEALQYADLAEWLIEILESEEAEAGREFWRMQNFSASLLPQLPFEGQFTEESDFNPHKLGQALEPKLVSKIDNLLSKYDVAANAFFLACWQTLLWRLTGWSDLMVGVACHGRTYEELEGAIGLLAKHLPLRTHLDADLKFSNLLSQVNETIAEIFEYQEYFSGDDNAITFPFSFDFEDYPAPYVTADNVTFAIDTMYACIEPFKIKLTCTRSGDALTTTLHYDSNLFEAAAIERLMGQFQALLNSVVDNPTGVIDEFNILSQAEQQQLLVEFNDTQASYPSDKCIFHLVEEQAARVPDNVAVRLMDEQLTYRQLDSRANQLAHHLQKLGVGPDVMVGLYLEQSVDILVGILGILKAGGAYVPLDPEYPKERIALILEDTQAPVLLTQQPLLSEIPEHQAKVVCIDSDWKTIARESEENPATDTTPKNFAYVIYTSGSTGRPKGVPISHQNLVHSTYARTLYYQDPVARYLLLSSFAFDSSIAGIFWALCQGGTLVLPPAGLQRDPLRVTEVIARHKVTHLLSLPSLYALLLSESDAQKLASLQAVVVAGEACPTELVKNHQNQLPQAALYNEYGPTEGTVWSTVYNCRSFKSGISVPIGQPIANAQVYLLNSRLQPVPVGVPGELYVGGAGVAKGYLNRPDLTAEKFIANPFNSGSSRLYKTGDLARYLPDGNIEFLGRIDHQVKIRGYRIELGEIEAVLGQQAAVQEAVVAAREDTPGDKRLVAYLVASEGQSPTVNELRDFLGEKLPDFMIPAVFVFLDALPLNPNGKVDRQALPEPSRTRPELAKTYVAPRNPVEEVLTGIWAEVLDLERVGIHDNFFELGGHSILVTRLVGQVRDNLRIDVALRAVFETPTVAELAEAMLQDPAQRTKVEKTAQLLIQLDQLSEDDVETMLDEKNLLQATR